MHRERECRGEEERHRDHMRRIVVEVQILVADIRHPIEMAENAIGETVSPCAQKNRADHDECDVGENRNGEGNRHMKADAELTADLDFTQCP